LWSSRKNGHAVRPETRQEEKKGGPYSFLRLPPQPEKKKTREENKIPAVGTCEGPKRERCAEAQAATVLAEKGAGGALSCKKKKQSFTRESKRGKK